MDELNQKFLSLSEQLKTDAKSKLEGILLFDGTKLIVYKLGQLVFEQSLNLDNYNCHKTLAHLIVYYSEKHQQKYNTVGELCSSINSKLTKVFGEHFISQCNNLTISDLMSIATENYLAQLHQVVQTSKADIFQNQWPDKLLVIVSGPSSPRFGHPAMQYFSRLANVKLEMNETMGQIGVSYVPVDPEKYSDRKLYYVENGTNLDMILRTGLSLYVEEMIFSRYQNMKVDILANNSQKYLLEKCGK